MRFVGEKLIGKQKEAFSPILPLYIKLTPFYIIERKYQANYRTFCVLFGH